MKAAKKKTAFTRHKTPESLLRAWFSMGGQLSTPKDFARIKMGGGTTGADLLRGVKRRGLWAFHAEDVHRKTGKKRRSRIHIWHDKRRNLVELAFVLGHEHGHATEDGRKLRGIAEERRANHYGRVAALVVKRLLGLRQPIPPEDEL